MLSDQVEEIYLIFIYNVLCALKLLIIQKKNYFTIVKTYIYIYMFHFICLNLFFLYGKFHNLIR